MIDRKIAKIKIRRGTDAQRKQVDFEEGELIYTTDRKRIFVGDNNGIHGTYGGNLVGNKSWIVSNFELLSGIEIGDAVYNTNTSGFYVLTASNYLLESNYILIGGSKLTVGYELPIATDIRLGGVKIGNNIRVSGDGTISIDNTTFIKSPTALNGQVLTYNTTTSTWVASSISSGGGGGGSGDFIPKPTTNLDNGRVLAYDLTTSTWVASSISSGGGGGGTTIEDLIPIGTVNFYAASSIPTGYLECDGSTKSKAEFPDLFAVIGTTFNTGTEETSAFRLPDLRGEFIRGWSHGRTGVDTGRDFGKWQKGSIIAGDNDGLLGHSVGSVGTNNPSTDKSVLGWDVIDSTNYNDVVISFVPETSTVTNTTGTVHIGGTRPRNVALLPCIKAVKVAATITPLNFIEKPASPTDGQSLVYSSSQNKWIPGAPSGGGDVPVGTVTYFSANTPPAGYLECDGTVVSRYFYSDLFSVIGTTFNTGSETVSTFRLPDLRGEFVRGWSHGRTGVDATRQFGKWQPDELKAHSHTYSKSSTLNEFTAGGVYKTVNSGDSTTTTGSTTGAETRPRNVALLPCIKALKTGNPSIINYIEKPTTTSNGDVLIYNESTNTWLASAYLSNPFFRNTLIGEITANPNGTVSSFGNQIKGRYEIKYERGVIYQNVALAKADEFNVTFFVGSDTAVSNPIKIGEPYIFDHSGGDIACYVYDSAYTDNSGTGFALSLWKLAPIFCNPQI